MATKKQKEKKKKERELKSKARVVAKRYQLRQIRKQESRSAKLNKKFSEKLVPIIKDPEKKKMMEENENKKVLEKLEKNRQILQALEDEYLKEKEQKKKINDQLESEGYSTLKDKINALEQRARENMIEDGVETIDLTEQNDSKEPVQIVDSIDSTQKQD